MTPINKIMTSIGIIGLILILIIFFLKGCTPYSYKYDLDIVIGKTLKKNNNEKELPKKVIEILKIKSTKHFSEKQYFISNSINILYYYNKNQGSAQIDSVYQQIELYRQKLSEKEKNYDTPEIKFEKLNNSLDEELFSPAHIDANSYKKKIEKYIEKDYFTDILIFSSNESDSGAILYINNESYEVITNFDSLLSEKYLILNNNKKNDTKTEFLLLYDPVLETRIISITKKVTFQSIYENLSSNPIKFSCSTSPDSILWSTLNLNNVTIQYQSGNGILKSQKIKLIDKESNGHVRFRITPYKKGHVSKDFMYTINVKPLPDCPQTIKVVFDNDEGQFKCTVWPLHDYYKYSYLVYNSKAKLIETITPDNSLSFPVADSKNDNDYESLDALNKINYIELFFKYQIKCLNSKHSHKSKKIGPYTSQCYEDGKCKISPL